MYLDYYFSMTNFKDDETSQKHTLRSDKSRLKIEIVRSQSD